jgi:hypothetical protein
MGLDNRAENFWRSALSGASASPLPLSVARGASWAKLKGENVVSARVRGDDGAGVPRVEGPSRRRLAAVHARPGGTAVISSVWRIALMEAHV